MKQESDGRQSLKDEVPISSTRAEARTDVDHATRAEEKDCKRPRNELKADESKASAQEHKAVDDAWCCPICLSWFDMPIVTPCGHSFCGECIKSVVAAAVQRQRQARAGALRPRCPICREEFDPNSLTPNVRLFEEMIKATVVCQNGDCTLQICPLRWKHHQSVCPALTVDCTFKGVGCDWRGARRSLPDHIRTCAYEKIKGLLPRVAVPLKNLHIKVHALEARLAAQNATVTNMRAAIVGMQHKGRHEVLPAVYALLWRPRDWRVYSCPHPGVVLSNATLLSLVPVAFLALRGLGSFGGGSPSFEQTMVYFTGLAALGFEAIVENDNTAPWHEIQQPLLLKGLRIGPTLVEISTALITHAVIDSLPWWRKPIVLILLLAPLTYPILVQGLHRLQVKLKRSFDEAQRAQAQRSGQPSPAGSPKEIPLKMHGPVTTGVFCAAAMLLLGHNAVLAGQALSRIGVCVASAVLGPEAHKARLERWRDMIAADYPDGEKEHIRQLHKKYFRSMEAPFPRMTSVTARGCLASVCICIFVAVMYAFRHSLDTIGYSLMAVAFNIAYLKWEVLVGQWVMASLQQTTSRLNQDPNNNRSASFCLLRSRILVVWVMIGSMFFVFTVLTP